jgi:hypothetical protein
MCFKGEGGNFLGFLFSCESREYGRDAGQLRGRERMPFALSWSIGTVKLPLGSIFMIRYYFGIMTVGIRFYIEFVLQT